MFSQLFNFLQNRKYIFFFLYLLLGLLSFSPYLGSFIGFIVFVPFFFYLYKEKNLKNILIVSFYAGGGFFLINSYWIYRFTVVGILLLTLYLTMYWLIYGLLFYYLKNKKYFLFYFPLIWTIFQILRGFSRFGYSWGEIGYSVSEFLHFSNVAAIGGVHLITFILVVINLILATYIYSGNKVYIKKGLIIFLITLVLGSFIYYLKTTKKSRSLNISVIQPSIDLFAKWDNDFVDDVMEKYYNLAMKVDSDSNLVVWPETAFVNGVLNYHKDRDTIKNIIMDQKSNAFHMVGTTLRRNRNNYNSLFLIDKNGNYDYYSKIMLVPFSEFLPFEKYTKFLMDIYPIQYLLSRGDKYKVFEMGDIKFSGIICFESIFPHFIDDFIQNGAQFLVVSTNDGWYIDTLAPYQHLQFARMRAIEQNRYFVQCANSGISAFINNRGVIYNKLGEKKQDILEDKIYLINKKSIYFHIKDYYWIIISIIALAFYIKEYTQSAGRE